MTFNNGVTGKMICDSVSPEGIRLSTIHVRYPRMIHSELMTHRVFSRNGRSSRAVPVATLLKEDHYTPHFMKNKPGMVATEEMNPFDYETARRVWDDLVKETKKAVERLNALGVHKQWANRPLEWFGYIDVLISSTDWANFMALRDDEAAQPEIYSVAQTIKQLLEENKPKLLKPGEWHLPYIDSVEDYLQCAAYIASQKGEKIIKPQPDEVLDLLKKISVARCARLSYRPFADGDASIEKELARYERLIVSRPVHASPAEHQATPEKLGGGENRHEWGNFYKWRQFRKMIPDNTIEDIR